MTCSPFSLTTGFRSDGCCFPCGRQQLFSCIPNMVCLNFDESVILYFKKNNNARWNSDSAKISRCRSHVRARQRDFADASHSKSAKSATRTVSYGIFNSENSYPYTATRFPLIASLMSPESSQAVPALSIQPDPSLHLRRDNVFRALPNAPGLPRSGG